MQYTSYQDEVDDYFRRPKWLCKWERTVQVPKEGHVPIASFGGEAHEEVTKVPKAHTTTLITQLAHAMGPTTECQMFLPGNHRLGVFWPRV